MLKGSFEDVIFIFGLEIKFASNLGNNEEINKWNS